MTRIFGKLAAVRRRIRLQILFNAVLLFLAIGGVVVAGSFLLDWLFQLPLGARVVMLIAMVGVMVWGALRFFVLPNRVRLSDDDIALLVERRHPEYGDELITAVQLSRQLDGPETGESREMIAATVDSAAVHFANETFTDTVSWKGLVRPALFGIGALALVALYSNQFPANAGLWARRVLLLQDIPWPPKTRLLVRIPNLETFNHRIADDGVQELYLPENSPLRLEVVAEGEVPSSVRIRKYPHPRASGATPINIEMPSREEDDVFEYKFGRVSSSFEFHVEGGDDRDEDPYFRILVHAAPRVNELTVDYDYPDYVNEAGRADREGVREYNVVAPVGTEVTMNFTVSSELDRFDLIFDDDTENPTVLSPVADEPTRYRRQFTLTEDHFYTWRLAGTNGTSSREAPDFNISAQPDLPPQISVVMPETSILDVTAQATVPVKVFASDDFRVGGVQLFWDTMGDGAFANRIVPSDDDLLRSDDGRELSAYSTIELRSLRLIADGEPRAFQTGDGMLVRIEAFDTRSLPGAEQPNRATYPTLLSLNVREPAEVERELMRTQIRLKDQVQQAREAVAARIEELQEATDSLEGDTAPDAKDYADSINTIVAGQDLVTSSLAETSRGFVRVFDGYLFNRMDPSNLTESLIAAISTAHRTGTGTHFEVVTDVVPTFDARADDSETMGKLVRLMNLLLDASGQLSPAVRTALENCLGRETPEQRREALAVAQSSAEDLRRKIDLILEKMEEWEDFQSIVQSLKDIIELERGLAERVKRLVK